MNCLKCGKEAQGNNVFCPECLLDASAYPVKPGTALQLHPRNAAAERKAVPRFRTPTPAEQIQQLRGSVRWLSLTVAVLSVVLCLTAAMLIHTLNTPAEDKQIGKNYTTVDQ